MVEVNPKRKSTASTNAIQARRHVRLWTETFRTSQKVTEMYVQCVKYA